MSFEEWVIKAKVKAVNTRNRRVREKLFREVEKAEEWLKNFGYSASSKKL